MSAVLTNLISQLRAAEHGQLIDKNRVIDHLLDLRSVAADDAAIVAVIDRLLVDAPGLTVVETTWWDAALAELSALADRQPAY